MSSCILYKYYRIQINGANINEVAVYRAKLIYFISFQLYDVLSYIMWWQTWADRPYNASNIKLFRETLWQVDNLFSLLRIIHLMKRIIVNWSSQIPPISTKHYHICRWKSKSCLRTGTIVAELLLYVHVII
jgi:hypothetical protein